MVFKTRSESNELKRLRSLNSRMELAEKDARHYFSVKKGFEVERRFDEFLSAVPGKWFRAFRYHRAWSSW